MKKFLTAAMAVMMLAGCSKSSSQPTATPEVDYSAKSEGVMTYAEYDAAELDTKVTIEAFVQGHQDWWEGKIKVYAQDPDGAYFLYDMPCSEEDAAKLVEGQKIKVTGYKSEWAGEVEITFDEGDMTALEIEDGNWIAEAVNADELWGSPDMITMQNRKVYFTGVTVEEYTTDADGATGAAFAYKNPTDKTDDLYVQLTKGDTTYEFCVEYYLCNEETDVYKAVEALNIGDVVDVEGFLYWYNGPNLHITAVGSAK
ncbi:MAG: hypothetical protein IJL95_00215 [Solobacterium sp.]|nr:hypothetical protein [Solobacterium sp.]